MTDSVLIIGATSAIGSSIAHHLKQRGISLHLTGRKIEILESLAHEVGGTAYIADVTVEDQIISAVEAAVSASENGLSGLVYCPGSIVLKPLSRVTSKDMADAYALNVIGAALAVKAATPALKKAHGSVVLFSTIAVSQGFTNHAIIASAKGGVEALVRSLAAELAPDIRVNCIAPSLTNTPLAKGLTSNPSMADAIAKMHPVPRLGNPDDHASLAAFLLSEQAGWITGQVIHVDGGRSTLRPKG